MNEQKHLKSSFLLCVAIVLTTIGLFLPIRTADFLIYDDNIYVTHNPLVNQGLNWGACKAAFTASYGCNWHPITTLSHMLDCQIYGLQSAGHHLTNVMIHAINALLLFGLLRIMTGAVWRSIMVAALFAWHPLHVESVAWIAERKDVLSTFFGLLSLIAYTKYVHMFQLGGSKQAHTSSNRMLSQCFYGLTLIFFLLALMSKPMLVTLPFVMLLLDFWPFQRAGVEHHIFRGAGRLILEKLPFFALSSASCVVTFWAQHQGGAVESLEEIPLTARFSNTVVAYLRYAELMLYPSDLALPYPHPGYYPFFRVITAASVLLACTTLAIWQIRRRPYFTMGWFWYLGMLVPVIGLIQVGDQAMADRYTYLPLTGLFIALVWGVSEWAGENFFRRGFACSIAILILLACAVVTEFQLRYWKNSETLFSHTLKVTHDNAWAEVNYGCVLYDKHEYEASRDRFLTALRLKPHASMTLLNLGKVSEILGENSKAINYYQDAISRSPGNAEISLAYGNALARTGRVDEAAANYKAALVFNPDNAMLQCNYGVLLSRQGNMEDALEKLREAIRLDPSLIAAQLEIGNLLAKTGRSDEAIAAFRKCFALQPTNEIPHLNLGGLYEEFGQGSNALPEYREAIRLQPGSARARSNLGVLLAKEGQAAEAEIQFKHFADLEPTNANAYYNLGNVMMAQKKYAAAATAYSNVIRFDAQDVDASFKMAVCQAREGNVKLAADGFQKTLDINSKYVPALIELAWLLATHSDTSVRNGREAVSLARKACTLTAFGDVGARASLDAALAEAGSFEEAAEAADKTHTLAAALNQPALAEAAAKRQALYREHQPFHLP